MSTENTKTMPATVKTTTVTFRTAYQPDTPADLLENDTAVVAMWELLRAEVEIDSIKVSHETTDIDESFGEKHSAGQGEVAEQLMYRLLVQL